MALWLNDEWEGGPMIRRAGTAAFGLYSVCGLWIARHTTDGFIPADVAADYGSKEWAAKLVDAGLWEIVEGGFRDRHYLDLNPTAEKVAERRQKEADRKARWRATRDKTRESRRDTARDDTRESPSSLPCPPKGGRGTGASAQSHLRAVDPEAPIDWRTLPVPQQLDEQQRDYNAQRAAQTRAHLAEIAAAAEGKAS